MARTPLTEVAATQFVWDMGVCGVAVRWMP